MKSWFKNKSFVITALVILLVVGWTAFDRYSQEGGKITAEAAVVTSYNPETQDVITNSFVQLNVPFVSQAPLGNWDDPRQEKGCEVTSVLMANLWLKKEGIDPRKAEKAIIAGANFAIRQGYYGFNFDDAVKIMKEYHHYDKIESFGIKSIDEIKTHLKEGNIVLLPALGRRLNNPNFLPPGPPTHMIVIRGFDDRTSEFISNDPGTTHGENYRYPYKTIQNAMVDYPSNHRSTKGTPKTIVVVER
jgi:hypothetical protein